MKALALVGLLQETMHDHPGAVVVWGKSVGMIEIFHNGRMIEKIHLPTGTVLDAD